MLPGAARAAGKRGLNATLHVCRPLFARAESRGRTVIDEWAIPAAVDAAGGLRLDASLASTPSSATVVSPFLGAFVGPARQ